MKYIGIILILAASILLGRYYSEKVGTPVHEIQEFIRLLKYMRERISSYLEPVSQIAMDFQSDVLMSSGFSRSLAECGRIENAYLSARGAFSFGKDEDEILESFFSHTGKGYLDAEIRLIDSTVSALEDRLLKSRDKYLAKGKSINAISIAIGLGLSILLI